MECELEIEAVWARMIHQSQGSTINSRRFGEGGMGYELPLDKMSVEEKLQAIEALWSSLRANPEQVPSPDWHKQLLADREQRLETGKADLSDWQDAKKRLQDLGR